MKPTGVLSAFLLAVSTFGIALTGCDSRQAHASDALSRYQTAAAIGDLHGSREALIDLVSVDDGVADYWAALGKTHLELADYGGAYNAFLKAHELNRGDASVLAIITQLTLRADKLDQAEEYARQLELIAPGDPTVGLTYGYAALRRGDLVKAEAQAANLLAASPYDPSAKVLRARILLQAGEDEQAIALLQEQVRLQPTDQISLSTLVGIFELLERWPESASTARRLLKLQLKNHDLRARLIDHELRAGQVKAASLHTEAGLAIAGAPDIDRLLAPWLATRQDPLVGEMIFDQAQKADSARRVEYARFFARTGHPNRVLALMRSAANVPVEPVNLAQQALFAEALAMTSDPRAGRKRLDQILGMDPGNADALRGRAILRSKAGEHRQAIEDATRLVATHPASSDARLQLANVYVAAGEPDNARRVLWEAFNDIRADRSIYVALKNMVGQLEGPVPAERVTKEFADQRKAAMSRGFI